MTKASCRIVFWVISVSYLWLKIVDLTRRVEEAISVINSEADFNMSGICEVEKLNTAVTHEQLRKDNSNLRHHHLMPNNYTIILCITREK